MDTYEKLRAAIYATAAALFGVLFVYRLATQEQIAAWLLLVAAAVPLLSLLNVPGFRKAKDESVTVDE
jgi:hypothetical protein